MRADILKIAGHFASCCYDSTSMILHYRQPATHAAIVLILSSPQIYSDLHESVVELPHLPVLSPHTSRYHIFRHSRSAIRRNCYRCVLPSANLRIKFKHPLGASAPPHSGSSIHRARTAHPEPAGCDRPIAHRMHLRFWCIQPTRACMRMAQDLHSNQLASLFLRQPTRAHYPSPSPC